MQSNKYAKLKEVFCLYLNDIDDFYEAKEEFISDLNKIFKTKGDKGFVCKYELERLLSELKKL